MLTLRKIAVTGGLASGKSSVCQFFKKRGAYVISADEIVHQLLSINTDLGQQVISLLGSDIVVNDQIDRGLIACKVFKYPLLLQSLERLVHPAVLKEIEHQYKQVRHSEEYSSFVAEIPLLFETAEKRMLDFFDLIIAVVADPEASKKRFQDATGYTNEEYDRRMARQLDPKEKAKRAHYVLTNNGSLNDLQEAFQTLYDQIISKP